MLNSTPKNSLNSTYTLPCGVTLKNRLVKAAMTERISDRNLQPVKGHRILYEKWADSGAGLLISGNVIIDGTHLESAGNVSAAIKPNIPAWKKWAEAGKRNDTQFWVQLNHAGRQTNRFNARKPKAASAVALKKLGFFGMPTPMSESDIQDVIHGFTSAALLVKKTGFTGIQIHAAHGYLLSQFLSPKTNLRTDQWGGSVENRSRILIEIIRAVRKQVGHSFPLGVKLNSSDFQRGGFTEDDSLKVIGFLENEGIDLLEISGGTYEKVSFFEGTMPGDQLRESTRKREAYFISFAQKLRQQSKVPLMITGGFRTREYCDETLLKGELDLIGMGRPFITDLDKIPGFIAGQERFLRSERIHTGIRSLNDAAEGGFYARQLIRMSKGKEYNERFSAIGSSFFLMGYEFRKAMMKKRQ